MTHISQGYWQPLLLMEITRGVGIPLQLDQPTRQRRYGHFVRVLVGVDMSQSLPSTLWVEMKGHRFHVDITYDKLPQYCSHCSTVGHALANCRLVHPNRVEHKARVVERVGVEAEEGKIVDMNLHFENISVPVG